MALMMSRKKSGGSTKKMASITAYNEATSYYLWAIDNNGTSVQNNQAITYTDFFSIPAGSGSTRTRTLTANVDLTIYKGNMTNASSSDVIHVSAGNTYQITIVGDTYLIVED